MVRAGGAAGKRDVRGDGGADTSAEARLRDFAEASYEWFWEQDADLRFTYFSANAEAVSGFAPDAFIGKTRGETRPVGLSPEAWRAHLRDLFYQRPFRDLRFARQDGEGRLRWYQISGKPIFDAAGQFAGYRGVGRDITAELEAEARARTAEDRLTDAVESLSDGFVLFDAEDRVVLWNSRMAAWNPGLTEAARGRPFAESFLAALASGVILRPPGYATDRDWVDHVLALRRHGNADYELATADGRWIACRDRRTRDGGIVGVRVDITEAKQREVELAAREARAVAAEQRLRDAIEAMSDTFVIYDADDRVVLCNQSYIEESGFASMEAIRGRTYRENMRELAAQGFFADPRAKADPDAFLAERTGQRAKAAGVSEIALSNGHVKRVKTRRIRDGGLVSIMTDVTEDRAREARALAAEQRLRAAIEAMSDGFSLRGPDDRLIMCNRRHLEIFGFRDQAEIDGTTWGEVAHLLARRGFYAHLNRPEDADAHIAERSARLKEGDHHSEVRTSDGRILSLYCRRAPDGSTLQITSDVTRERERELRLRRAEFQLRDAIDSMNEAFVLRDGDDRPVLCNQRYLEMLGFESLADFAHLTSDGVRRHLLARGFFAEERAAENPESWLRERDAHRSGSRRPADVKLADGRTLNARTQKTRSGDMVTILSDVTMERDREARLRAAEARLREAIDSIEDGFSLWNAEDRLVLWNRSFGERMARTGSPPTIGQTYRDFVLMRAREGSVDTGGLPADRFVARALDAHRRQQTRESHLPDGRVVLIRERKLPDGGIVRLDTDITARKRQEQLVRDAEARLRAAIDSIEDGFTLWSQDDRLVLWNRSFEARVSAAGTLPVQGMSYRELAGDLIARGAVALDGRTPEDRLDELIALHHAAATRETTVGGGRVLLVRERRVPGHGTVRIDTDITDRKRQEAQTLEAKEAAEQANRSKSAFLASMSHELRTPLNAILGFSETMAREMLGALGNRRYVEYANDIHKSGHLLLDLINDMLDMSRIEAGRYELRRETVRPAEIAREALDVIAVQAEKAQVAIEERIEASLPRLALDRRAVRQVMLNLLSNAIKFSHAGGSVTVTLDAGPGQLRFAVADCGIGIAKEDLGRIARPFERVGNVMTQPIQGTGLGLSISKRLIELHGGELRIDSELGRGTTVTVLLPIG